MNRRGFLLGLGAALAAPAIVRASSLMPVRALAEPLDLLPPFVRSVSVHLVYVELDGSLTIVNKREELPLPAGWSMAAYGDVGELKIVTPAKGLILAPSPVALAV